jgi:hypothetical protein
MGHLLAYGVSLGFYLGIIFLNRRKKVEYESVV